MVKLNNEEAIKFLKKYALTAAVVQFRRTYGENEKYVIRGVQSAVTIIKNFLRDSIEEDNWSLQNEYVYLEKDGMLFKCLDKKNLPDGQKVISFKHLEPDAPYAIGQILSDQWINIGNPQVGITGYLLKGKYEIVSLSEDKYGFHIAILKAVKKAGVKDAIH